MRALRWHGNQDIRVDTIPEPVIKPGHVKVKIAWCGICGSDLHEYRIGPKNAPVDPHPVTGEKIPTVVGHEFSGVVSEVGEGVSDLKPGDKAVVFPLASDMTCEWCLQEAYGCCPNWGFMGYSGIGGGISEYIVVQRRDIHKVPDHIPLDIAALVEPLAVGWHAAKLGKPQPGNCCLVLGAGPIGLAVVHALVAMGVTNIIVSEVSQLRGSMAKKAGATHVVSPKDTDVQAFAREHSPAGFGAHAVYEAAGHPSAFATALAAVRGRGTIVTVAMYETDSLELSNPNVLIRRQVTWTGSSIYFRHEFDEVIEAIASGKMKNPEAMITGRVPLERCVEDAFGQLIKGVEGHVKILVGSDPSL